MLFRDVSNVEQCSRVVFYGLLGLVESFGMNSGPGLVHTALFGYFEAAMTAL
jgi:hypothetical protein